MGTPRGGTYTQRLGKTDRDPVVRKVRRRMARRASGRKKEPLPTLGRRCQVPLCLEAARFSIGTYRDANWRPSREWRFIDVCAKHQEEIAQEQYPAEE